MKEHHDDKSKTDGKIITSEKFRGTLKPTKSDKAKFVINSITSSVLAGFGAATGNPALVASSSLNVLSNIIGFPMGKRMAESIVSLAEKLEELEKTVSGFKIENMINNELFITTILQAVQIAARNHQKEKIDALHNAVLNAAIGNSPDEDLHLMFLHNIDSLTSWHLKILDYFRDPQGWFQIRGKDIPEVSGGASFGLELAFEELQDNEEFYSQIVNELITKGFLHDGKYLNVIMSSSGVYAKRTTDMGDKFLTFITSPLNKMKN